jgi:hypothetical protein
LTLIDEGDQFRGCSLGPIADLHTSWHLSSSSLEFITGEPHRRQIGPVAESAERGIAQSSMFQSDGVVSRHCCTNESQTRLNACHRSMVSPMEVFHGARVPRVIRDIFAQTGPIGLTAVHCLWT